MLRRIVIIVLACVLVLIVVCAIIFKQRDYSYTPEYRGDEEVKDYDYLEYTLIDTPDVTILDQDGVKLRLASVYANTENKKYDNSSVSYRLGFSLVNKRKEPIRLLLRCDGINGRCDSSDYFFIYSHFKGYAEVVFYESVYGEWFDSIDEIVIGECYLSDENGIFYENYNMETFKLNDKGYTVINEDKDMGNVIFENDQIRIRSLEQENDERRYDVWIENLSENNYYIDTSDIKVDGKVDDTTILYGAGLPAGYTLHHDSVYGLGEVFKNRADDAVVELSFSFSDPVDPKNDFSTGYITLK